MGAIGNMTLTEAGYKPKYGLLMDGKLYIKVNLPSDGEAERSGNGEGVWGEVDEETCRAYDGNVTGGEWHGKLANDSLYYPGLACGDELPFTMNGGHRPTTPLVWPRENYGESIW